MSQSTSIPHTSQPTAFWHCSHLIISPVLPRGAFDPHYNMNERGPHASWNGQLLCNGVRMYWDLGRVHLARGSNKTQNAKTGVSDLFMRAGNPARATCGRFGDNGARIELWCLGF